MGGYTNLIGNLDAWWLGSKETDALHLTLVVKSDNSDECIWVFLKDLPNLLQNLGCICAPKHGQLPHCPVASIVVSW